MGSTKNQVVPVLARFVLGTFGGGFGVQQGKTAPGYVIAEVEVTDAAAMQKYGEKVRIWRANGRR